MCKPEMTKGNVPVAVKAPLLSVDAYAVRPSLSSMLQTGFGILGFLFAVEFTLRLVIFNYQHLHPLLEDETNRYILARHVGTDFLCCAVVGLMGWTAWSTVCPDILEVVTGKPGAMPKAGFEARMFNYRPASMRICVFFFAYQVKNMYDCLIWMDGPEFIVHHLMCMFVAYGAIFHDTATFYAPFYFGISEFSTAVLCLLANFDDRHGVPGLAEAFPTGKVVFGALFAVAFISLRVVMWSFMTYYFINDSLMAVKAMDPRTEHAKPWIKVLLGCNIGLTALQVIWLGQIVIVGKEEIAKVLASA